VLAYPDRFYAYVHKSTIGSESTILKYNVAPSEFVQVDSFKMAAGKNKLGPRRAADVSQDADSDAGQPSVDSAPVDGNNGQAENAQRA
jgi:hypothetical protein